MWLTATLAAFAVPPDTAAWEDVQAEPRVACATVDGALWCRTWGHTSADPQRVGALIEDRASYPAHYPHVVEVKAYSEDVHYTRIDLPSPFSDRDQLFRAERVTEGAALFYRWQATTRTDAPPLEGLVRLDGAAGEWRLEPGAKGGTDLRYTWNAEMGGSFPEWALWRAALMHADEMMRGTVDAVAAP